MNRILSIDGSIAAQNLLEHFDVGHHALAVADDPFERELGIELVRM